MSPAIRPEFRAYRKPRRLGPAQRELAASHVGWALALAGRYARAFPALADECASAALVGLAEAAADFDPRRGLEFRTLAQHRVIGAAKDALRSFVPKGYRRGDRGRIPAVESLDGNRYGAAAELEDGRDDLGVIESDDAIAALFRCLPERNRRVMEALYLHAGTSTCRAAGEAVGLSDCRVSMIARESIEIIRDARKGVEP